MIELFLIFSASGVVLFRDDSGSIGGGVGASKVDPIQALIRDVLIADCSTGGSRDIAEFTVKWLVAPVLDLLFVAVLDKLVAPKLKYVETLLESVKENFVRRHGDSFKGESPAWWLDSHYNAEDASDALGFRSAYNKILNAAEAAAAPSAGPLRSLTRGEAAVGGSGAKAAAGTGVGDAPFSPAPAGGKAGKAGKGTPAGQATAGAGATPSGKAGKGTPKTSADILSIGKYSKALEASLDRSAGKPASGGGDGSAGAGAAAAAAPAVERVVYQHNGATGRDLDDVEDGDDDLVLPTTAAAGACSGGGSSAAAGGAGGSGSATSSASTAGLSAAVSSWFTRSTVGSFLMTVAGKRELSQEDVTPIMDRLRTTLISKNVAQEVAIDLCKSVGASLVGAKVDSASSVAATVTLALRDAIERILTPRRPVDVLAEVKAKKAAGIGAPYVIVFCGINGVGKSTSLSKVAYHLKDNHHSVLIAACDSFRAGAVEQLKRHCTALDIPLYEQGYKKDPGEIARYAIKQATEQKIDVVLVDTAGRMQNNASHMQQLAKLVAINAPDLVLFVGEALVGNDGVDQLAEFDRSLVDYAVDSSAPRRIDGIVLTKFDTVDDKVGAALSMVYKTGIPIAFLGTGQKYVHLRKLNVNAVVKALLS